VTTLAHWNFRPAGTVVGLRRWRVVAEQSAQAIWPPDGVSSLGSGWADDDGGAGVTGGLPATTRAGRWDGPTVQPASSTDAMAARPMADGQARRGNGDSPHWFPDAENGRWERRTSVV
jgi:hypothetical protein